MLIQGGLVHTKNALSTEGLLRFIAAQIPAGRYFWVEPPPGIVMVAAIDWRVILHDKGDMAKLAEALWQCYENRLMPLNSGSSSSAAGILMQLKNEQGAFDQFTLGQDIIEKGEFLTRIDGSTRILFSRQESGAFAQELAETLASDYWSELD